jgi:orotidine-5'-phosphate decarboxylase
VKTKLIAALDVDTWAQAKKIVDRLYPSVKIFKVGSQLFTACGPKSIASIQKKGARVFLDLKFHDIPNTVAKAVAQAARLGVFMLTVHAQGGVEMLKAARAAAQNAVPGKYARRPLIIAVTVLTSQISEHVHGRVLDLADDAYASGMDGVVASVDEARDIRRMFKENFLIITPGIRPEGAERGDQKRVATPKAAIEAGSDFIVVGRPIVEAKDPATAAKDILREMRG